MKNTKWINYAIRRREAENDRHEKLTNVNKYFNKCTAVSAHHEQWSSPAQLKQAEDKFELIQKKNVQEKQLELRRQKMLELINKENFEIEQELKLKQQQQQVQRHGFTGKSSNWSSSHLNRFTADEKRRQDLEQRLYSHWRKEGCEHILLQSRTDNEALAKMNWLDEQIARKVEFDKQEKQRAEQSAWLKEELQRQDEEISARSECRRKEMENLNTKMQTIHLNGLKEITDKCKELQLKENQLKQLKSLIEQSKIELEQNSRQRKEKINCPINLRRIKITLRQLCQLILKNIENDLELLDKLMEKLGEYDDNLSAGVLSSDHLINRSRMDGMLCLEQQRHAQIEIMFESEAKQYLLKQIQIWHKEETDRTDWLNKFLQRMIVLIEQEIQRNLNMQREQIGVKEAHLNSIEQSNEQIKFLMESQRDDENKLKQFKV